MKSVGIRCGFVGLMLGALVLGGCKASTPAAFEKAAAELPAAEAQAMRLGLPLSGEELMPASPIPAKDNAAPLLAQAGKDFLAAARSNKEWDQRLARAIADPATEDLALAATILKPLNPSLDQAVVATQLPQYCVEREWARPDPWNILFPELAGYKAMTKGLVYRAQLRAIQGDRAGAVKDFRAAAQLAEFAGSDPLLIPAFVQIALDAILCRGMEYTLARHPDDREWIDALEDIASRKSKRPMDLLYSLRGEVVISLETAKLPGWGVVAAFADSSDPDDPKATRRALELKEKLAPRDVSLITRHRALRARALQVWVKIYADQEANRDMTALIQTLEQVDQNMGQDGDPTTALRELALPDLAPAARAYVKRELQWQVFRGLLAVMRFRAAQSRFPKSMEEAGFTELDLFNGTPLNLKVEGETIRVYSMGSDGEDHQGQERIETPDGNARTMDVSSMFPRRVTVPGAPPR